MTAFVTGERLTQGAFFAKHMPAGAAGFQGSAYRLMPEHRALNLAPIIRDAALAYFAERGITWHQHANHALSSQVACLNFLMPLATRPEVLSQVVGEALGMPPPVMLPVENGPKGQPWFVAFEWIGRSDYLNEAGRSGGRTRGANATSADAIVRFEAKGRIETLLIEWKYTESYGAPIPPKGNVVRLGRYQAWAFAPVGPIRSDLDLSVADFFWEPFYQLLRQQMVAFRMQKASEDGTSRVRVLHISPAGNRVLHATTAPALRRWGDDAFAAFSKVLVCPDDFVCRSVETVFGPALRGAEGEALPWAQYLLDRYGFLAGNRNVVSASAAS